ncbi:serine-rich adhesin for platelets isoform X3 [Cryptotermes secundus]|uniref:serine-rich adhesin for platelets isoform X3 n=1 Tax=Cryptotermes secundus TaxID=105785 RepID=UPI001454C40B|nr:serine-rich adhesin for platelets isoform X3 [Cryptotermes secundus]
MQGLLGLEATLNDPKKRYPDKVNALLSAWEHVTAFIATSAHEASETLIDWVHRHTLYLVLQGEWPKLSPATKTHLSVTLQRCASLLSNHNAAPRCRTLIGLVNDPWGHPILHRILNGASDVDDSEVLELCQTEKGILLSMRLEMLCESKCEDLALKLAEAIHRCLRSRDSCFLEESSDEQFFYTIDMYIALLYKFKRIHDIIKELKHFNLKDGLLLVRRYALKDGKRARVWKYSAKVAELAAQYFLTVAMVKPVSETGTLLQDLMTEWALLHSDLPSVSQTLPNMIRKLIQPAESAVHIYLFCQVLVNQFGDALKSLCIELYIKGLTTDMNELEQQKMKNDKEKVREAEVRLSDGFLKLADLVKDNVGVCRECVLTAFSLNPTRVCYERIKEMAVASGKCLCLPAEVTAVDVGDKRSVSESKLQNTGTEDMDLSFHCIDGENQNSHVEVDTGQGMAMRFDHSNEVLSSHSSEDEQNISDFHLQRNRCNLHPPFDPSTGGALGELCPECGEFTGIESSSVDPSGVEKKERTLDALILIKGNTVTESLNYDVLSAPNQVLDAETLGLTPQLCDDLAVVLSSPRYQMLSWVLDWAELSIMCEKYLENCEEMRNTTKELKFLNIDYNQFKDWPSGEDEKDEYYGIEKGYEQWADLSSDTSEGYFNRSYKRRARRMQADSDSDSSLAPRSRTRGRKVHRLDSSDSDYDSSQRKEKIKHKNYRPPSLSVSDSDTGTQDSVTDDSLGSDGFRVDKPRKEKIGRKEKTSSGKRVDRKQLNDISHFRVMMNDDLNHGDLTSDLSNSDVMNIFAQIGDNGKEVSNTQFPSVPSINNITNPDKHSSDPSVLKTLRMFRPHNTKNSARDHLSQILHSRNKESPSAREGHGVTYAKFAPMLSTLNLNPRIVLTRADVSHQDLKSSRVLAEANNRPGNPLSQITPGILSRKPSQSKNIPYDVDGKNRIPLSHSLVGDVNRHEYMKSDLLVKAVPGLNSLDMIVPPPSEATVQVVQLPRNPPSTSDNSQGNSCHPPKAAHSQNAHSSGNSSGGTSGQDLELGPNVSSISTHSQPSQSSTTTPIQNPQGQIAISAASVQSPSISMLGQAKSKSNQQSEVKYLTTTSEVNEILRSTLGEGSVQVQTGSQVLTCTSLAKQKQSLRQEVKYLTSPSEVTEILRNTLSEGGQQVPAASSASLQHTSSALEFVSQDKTKLNSLSDIRYLTSTSEVNEILRNTPVVQKPVTLETNTCSGPSLLNPAHHTNHSHHVNSVSPFPVVKGVDLNVIASIISSKNCTNSIPTLPDNPAVTSDSQMLQLVCKSPKFQIKPVICTQAGPRSILADHADASTSAPSSSLCTEHQQQQQQAQLQQQNQRLIQQQQSQQQQQQQQQQVSTHSVYEEDFAGFPASVDSPSRDKSAPNRGLKQGSTQTATLPKFQQAFGKTIYNNQASTTVDGGSQSSTVRRSEDEDNPPRSTVSQETVAQASAVPSTVLSKAVQTTNMSNIVSHPPVTVGPQNESSSTADVAIPSTLHLTSTGSVFSILQGSPRIAVSAALRAGMTVQAIQTSSGVIYMHPDTTTLVKSSAGTALASTISARRTSDIKTSQSSESVQQVQLPDGLPSSVAVAITTPSSPVLTKDAMKRNRMLATALQSTHRSNTLSGMANQATSTSQLREPEVCVVESSSDEEVNNSATQQQQTLVTAAAVHRIMSVQKTVARQVGPTIRNVRPVLHIPGGGNLIARSSATTVASPLRQQAVRSVLVSPVSSTLNSNVNTRISQNVGASETLIRHGSIEPTVSSTTLEQLREFESVLEHVTNTSQMKERSTVQPQPQHTVLTQQLLLTQATSSTTNTGMEFTSCTRSQSTPSTYSQDLFPVASTTGATSRVNVTYVTQASTIRTTSIVPAGSVAGVSVTGKMSSPVVVVTSNCQPVASPALSVTSQSSSSPCVTPAPSATSTSSGKSPPKSSKSSKSKSVKSGTATTTSKSSPVPKPQQKPQEDEQTAQRIYAILDEYAEQLRNSPDLNNKPAPRRRSNPPTNANQSSKRKKSAQTKVKLLGQQSSSAAQEMSPGADDPRTMGSEDSSSGITQLSHIQDSPAPSSQNPDEPLSLRATPSVEMSTETGNLRSMVSDSGELQDVSKQQDQQSQEQSSHSHEQEQSDGQQSPVTLHQTTQHGLIFTDGSGIQGRTVIVQDSVPSSVDATGVGKPIVAGNSATVPTLFAGVRQVIVPVAPGLTARPVVVSSKGSKVIRVHQVTVPGGSLQMTPGMSTMQGTALVVRQINKSGIAAPVSVLGQPATVKQVKLPVGSISSQALSGVTAQPPVVLPPGSHHLSGQVGSVVTSTIAQALSFPESGLENVLQDSTIRTESSSIISSGETLLLNAATTSQAIGLIRRGIPTSFHDRISTPVGGIMSTSTSATVPTSVTVDRLTYPSVRQVSSVSLESNIVALNSSNSSIISSNLIEQLTTNNESSQACDHELPVETVSECRIETNPMTQSHATSVQCLGVDFVTQHSLRNTNFPNRLVKDAGNDVQPIAKSGTENCAIPSESAESRGDHVSVTTSCAKLESRKSDGSSAGRIEPRLEVESVKISDSLDQCGPNQHSDPLCATSPSKLHQAANSADQHEDAALHQTAGTNTLCTSALNEELFLQDGTAGSSQEVTMCMGTSSQEGTVLSRSSHLHLLENGLQKAKEGNMPDNCDSSSSSSSSSSGGGSSSSSSSNSSSSSDVLNVAEGCSNVPGSCRRESGPVSQVSGMESTSQMVPKSGCRTNTTQTHEFSARTGSGTEAGAYYVPSKSSHRLEYINDMAYRSSTKMTSESQDSPWRYMPVVKRVRVAIQPAVVQKDESYMATEQVGSALHLADRDGASEIEDGSQDRRSFLSDVKFLPVGRKAGIAANSHVHPNTVHTYRKLESEAEEKRRVEKVERIIMHQKMARLERELRLQKSLSEECEDLGVDEPSTSELFPEADLLLDPSSSPSFEQTIQDAPCGQTVETAEPYSGSNFRHEYSSSSQEGSHHEDPCVDNQVTDDSESRRETRTFGSKKSYSDWKYRSAGKLRSKCNTPVNLLRREKSSAVVNVMKDNSPGQSCHLNNDSKNISQCSSSVEESLNGSSKCDASDGVATSLVLGSSSEHTVEPASGKCNRNERSLPGDQRISLPEKSILAKTLISVTPRTASAHLGSELEEMQDKGPKQVLPGTLTIPCESNVEPKVDLPVTSSSSEDSVTLDSFATSMVASSLDVTIPSPVPAALSLMPSAHLLETSDTRNPLPTLTAAQKFTYTYAKKLPSSRQDVGRVIKRTRRPNQYFNDHVDSQETWDSSSSQDKIGADDEDSDEMSPSSQMSSQLDDGANTDVDVVEVSNDESSSSAVACVQSSAFPLLRTVLNKVPVSDPQNIDGTLKLSSTNGMDSIDRKSPTNSEKILSSKKNRPDKRFFTDTGTDSDFIGSNAKSARIREHRFDQSGLLHDKKIKGIPSLSKVNVPTKESTVASPSVDSSYKKQHGLCSKQQGRGDTCEATSVDPSDLQLTPASMTEIDMMPTPDGEDLVSKVCLEGKNECPSGGTCETHLKPTRSSRRRGHIKKCQCCNGSPERPKKKKHIVKVEKLIKKGQPPKQIGKMSVTKKR